MTRIVAVGIQKGGAGKTATVVNLAAALARGVDLRVLVLDFDEQRNATSRLLGRGFAAERTIESVLRGNATLTDAVVSTAFAPNIVLDVIPGSEGLSAFQGEFRDADAALSRIRDHLREQLPEDAYDIVLVDTPPAGGFWLQAALALADGLIAVTECESDTQEALLRLLKTVDRMRETHNPELMLDGVVLNRVDLRRRSVNELFLPYYRHRYAGVLLEPPVTYVAAVSDAGAVGTPVEFNARNSPSAKEYRQIAALLNARLVLGGVELSPA